MEKAVKLNAKVCELTVRKRIAREVTNGVLVRLELPAKKDRGVGRPEHTFILKALAKGLKARKSPKRTAKPSTPASVPVANVVPAAPTPVVVTPAPAPVTEPAVTATEPVTA